MAKNCLGRKCIFCGSMKPFAVIFESRPRTENLVRVDVGLSLISITINLRGVTL